MSDAAHVLWTLVSAYAVWRLAAVAEQFAPRAARAVAEEAPVEVPDDLVALALQQSETWAQEDTIKAMREKYELTKDWNLVRSAFGVGRVTT
jgi:hypothetical protein